VQPFTSTSSHVSLVNLGREEKKKKRKEKEGDAHFSTPGIFLRVRLLPIVEPQTGPLTTKYECAFDLHQLFNNLGSITNNRHKKIK
jgi:hypothetical protein